MKVISRLITPVCVFMFLSYLYSCSASSDNNTPITKTSAFGRVINKAKKDKRHLVMHSGIDKYKVLSVVVERSKNHFTVQLNKVDSAHLINVNMPSTIDEKLLHIYMKDSTSYTLDEPHTILLDRIARIERTN